MSMKEHILIHVADSPLAIASSSIHCVHDGLLPQREPDTADWFLGVAVADDRLLPVTDLGALLGLRRCTGRVLEVSRRFGIAGLQIDKVVGVSSAPAMPLQSENDTQQAAWTTSNIASEVLDNFVVDDFDAAHRVLDVASLVQSAQFKQIQLAPA